jgi:hypothetical protein
MKITPVHIIDEKCYRVYVIFNTTKQQVGKDYCYSDKKSQNEQWLNCLRYAREIESQVEYGKNNNND